MKITLENVTSLDFAKSPLIPAIVQDQITGVVLMQGYMNLAALEHTLQSEKVTFYSRSKERLWTKGESSGHFLLVGSVYTDCDKDAILVLATAQGPTCHTGSQSCFFEARHEFAFLPELAKVIKERKNASPDSSYTASLFAKDKSRSAQKVGEEGVEVALAAMKDDNVELENEAADLLYHLMVLLERQGTDLTNVINVLKARHKN